MGDHEPRALECLPTHDYFLHGVAGMQTASAYDRLKPPWNSDGSRFLIVQMPTLNTNRSYFPDECDDTNVTNAMEEGFDFEALGCNDFLEFEVELANELALAMDPCLNYGDYTHIEYLVPDIKECSWGECPTPH